MNWVDFILLAVLGVFALRGFFRGLFREVFSLAGLIVGFLAAARYNDVAAQWLHGYWQISPLALKGAAFVILFFLVYFCFGLGGWLLHRSEKLLFLKTLNRTGGIAIGAGKGAALAALVIFFLTSSSLLSQPTRDSFDGAYLVSPLSQLGERLVKAGKERIFNNDRAGPVSSGNRSAI